MHFKEIVTFLEDFEKTNKGFLLQSEIYGWNAWSIIKKPLYNLLRNSRTSGRINRSNKLNRTFRLITSFLSYFSSLLIEVIRNRKRPFFVSFNGSRIDTDGEGNFINPFIDPIILNNVVKKFIYFESFSDKSSKKQTLVSYDINDDGKKIPVNLVKLFLNFDKGFDLLGREFSCIMNDYIRKNELEIVIPNAWFSQALKLFIADYLWQSFLLTFFKPDKIFIVDGTPSGLIGAAVRRKIPVYEFQHGIIGSNKFEYMVDHDFKTVRMKMPYPDYVCLFGDYFKDLLNKSGFWDKSQLLVIGNSSIENRRKGIPLPSATKPLKILWATQPSVFNETIAFLEELFKLEFTAIIYLKPHPLEKLTNIKTYKEFQRLYKTKCIILDSYEGLLDALQEKDILVSYHSTSLLEAIALGFPSVTITSSQFPNGINDYLEKDFSKTIKPIRTPLELVDLMEECNNQNSFEQWQKNSIEVGNHFFKSGYYKAIETFN